MTFSKYTRHREDKMLLFIFDRIPKLHYLKVYIIKMNREHILRPTSKILNNALLPM